MGFIIVVIAGFITLVLFGSGFFHFHGMPVVDAKVIEVGTKLRDQKWDRRAAVKGSDRRSYTVYMEYEYEGSVYLAKSFRSYGQVPYFPGDRVKARIMRNDMSVLDIIRDHGNPGC